MNKQIVKDLKRREREARKAKAKAKRHSFIKDLRLFFEELEKALFAWDYQKGLEILNKNWLYAVNWHHEGYYYFDYLMAFTHITNITNFGRHSFFRKKWIEKNYLNLLEILKNDWCPEGFKREVKKSCIYFKPIDN